MIQVSAWLFVFGLVMGSFFNVLVYRLPRKESIVKPGSHCTACGVLLAWYELIPVFSYLYLRGKCSHCGSRISLQYPLVELFTAVLFVALWVTYGATEQFLAYLILSCFIIPLIMIDFNHGLLPDVLTIPGILTGLILIVLFRPESLSAALIGLGAGVTIPVLIALVSRGGMGGGDAKLLGMIGVYTGWPGALVALFAGSIVGAIVSLGLVAVRRKRMSDAVPFGPFLALGAWIFVFFGDKIIWWIRFRNSM